MKYLLLITIYSCQDGTGDFFGVNIDQAIYTGQQNIDSIKGSIFSAPAFNLLDNKKELVNDNIHPKDEFTIKKDHLFQSEFGGVIVKN